jgi:hypothetical protein
MGARRKASVSGEIGKGEGDVTLALEIPGKVTEF